MTKPPDNKAVLQPITGIDVADVALFLHKHMNGKFSKEEWQRGLCASWYQNAPNYGFMLRSEERVVGVICALYSEQEINGKETVVCNPHSWCVLEPYRGKSVSLVLSVIRQEGMHYTMYSPNSEGEEIFSYLGFKPLARDMRIVVNLPTLQLSRNIKTTTCIDNAIAQLTHKDQKCIADHRDFSWLHFLFYECAGKHGFLIYKREICKRLPCATLLYVSDKALFADCWKAIRTKLLVKHGIVTTKIEQRLLPGELPYSFSASPA